MTLNQKIKYLLDNGYVQNNHSELIKTFTSSDGQIKFSLRDIIYRWNSLRIF